MDSNGKYINTRRLFPGKQVTKIYCETTEKASEIIQKTFSSEPTHIVLHTGTNNINYKEEDIVGKLFQLTETAQKQFPLSMIILSSLLPRRDIPHHIIQNINAELVDKISSVPNTWLAQHSLITPHHLYDEKHPNKQGVSLLAKEIKDIVLNRPPRPGTNHINPNTEPTTIVSRPQTSSMTTQTETVPIQKGDHRDGMSIENHLPKTGHRGSLMLATWRR
ncbi:hypothetical protein XELAEV_18020322mg [Xenopus laevis]|uniref:SGNH hydrolase-type esterase domain-containing protein n=1 Tax=Xenopus laevis TaxID=8355 RepID=A0A974D710_XENLA|nr:hypothetical protein XELAEV_18020322mg [Xenopus laevis]